MPLTIPAQPEIVFGVWDRWGRPATADTFSAQVGYKVEPAYGGYGRYVRPSREEVQRYFDSELRHYPVHRQRHMIGQLELHTFLQGRTLTHIRPINGYNSGFEIGVEGGPENVLLQANRYSYRNPVVEVEGPFPKTVKRWLKTGKTIRFEDGTSAILTCNGRLKIQTIPEWLLEELFQCSL
jgi:hypothetical protein